MPAVPGTPTTLMTTTTSVPTATITLPDAPPLLLRLAAPVWCCVDALTPAAPPLAPCRVVHYADPVPHLPTEFMGFHHVSTEVWYREFTLDYRVCDGSGEDEG